MELVNKGKQIIRDFGIVVFLERLTKYCIFKLKRFLYPKDMNNLEKFKKIHNKYKGKRIFIIGNGSSLNEMPLYLLKDEYKMCFNHFPLMEERVNWFPQFYAITDDLVVRDMADELNSTIVSKVKYAFFPDIHPSNINFKKRIKNKDNILWLYLDNPDFSDRLPYCGINETVVNVGIQVAAYMGFSEIFLIGMDMTFNDKVQNTIKNNSRDLESKEDDPNHFDPRYFGKGKRYHYTPTDGMIERFRLGKKFFEERGVNIYNAGYGGKLEVFNRVRFENIFNMSEERCSEIFLNVLKSIDTNLELSSFGNSINHDTNFKINKLVGSNLVRELIKTHIPLGPYKEEYYFVKRRHIID